MLVYKEEGKIKGGIEVMTLEKIEKISEQMKTCICKIYGKIIGTGFFVKYYMIMNIYSCFNDNL